MSNPYLRRIAAAVPSLLALMAFVSPPAALAAPPKTAKTEATALAHYEKGNAFRDQGEIKKAINEYTLAIQISPRMIQAYRSRSNMFRAVHEPKSALADLEKALALEPDDAVSLSLRGTVRRQLAHRQDGSMLGTIDPIIADAVIADFNRAISLEPRFITAIAERGTTLMLMKREDAALADFNKVISLVSADASRFSHVENAANQAAIVQMGLERQVAAGAYYRRAILYMTRKEWPRSRVDLQHAMELDPTDPVFAIRSGQVLLESGQIQDIRKFVEALRKQHPNTPALEEIFQLL